MRICLVIVVLAVVLSLLGGCGSGSSNKPTVSGTVSDQISGQVPAGNTDVALWQNGFVANAGNNPISGGQFRFPNVTQGANYALNITSQSGTFPNTLVGPFTVGSSDVTIIAQVLTPAELQAQFGVTPPADNTTATLVVFARDNNGNPLTASAAIDGGIASAAGNPTVVTGIPPGSHTVVITTVGSGQSVTFTSVAMPGGAITVIKALFGAQTPISLAGTLTQEDTIPAVTYTSAPLVLRQNGTTIANTTTDSLTGTFAFNNFPAGVNYTIDASSPTNAFVRTIFGPSNLTASNMNVGLRVFTAAQLQTLFAATPPADNTTANLVVLARTDTATLIPLSVQINTTPNATASGAPVIFTGIAPGTYVLTITDSQTNQTVVIPNVTLAGGSLNMVRVLGSQLGFSSGIF